jgi:hypothetical protein
MDTSNHGCAMCIRSGSSVELKRCASCLVIYYCSRQCQKKHWKKHKKECITYGVPSTPSEEPPIESLSPYRLNQSLFEVRTIPDKGQGLLATCKIPKGTRILSEKPIFVVPRTVSDLDDLENAITKKLARLDEGHRMAFFANTIGMPTIAVNVSENWPMRSSVDSNCSTANGR